MDPEDLRDISTFQRDVSRRLMREVNTEDKLEIIEIFRSLQTNPSKRVHIEEVLLEARSNGIGDAECMAIVKDLVRDRVLDDESEGFYQLSF